MKRHQSGFTLIELIAVIVILGILAATAVPRFVDLQDEAGAAGASGVAGNISSASSLNYATDVAENAGLVGAGTGRANDPITTAGQACNTAAAALLIGGIPAGYTVDSGTNVSSTNGQATTCVVTHTASSQTANASIIATTDDA